MHEVKLKRKDLLKRIKKNRDAHHELFLKAQNGYRIAAIEELDRMLNNAKKGKPIRTNLSMVEPQDHTKDYDRVIDMLNMSIDDDITLDSRSFDNYVRDQWDWKQFADSTNIMYSTVRRKK